MKYDIFISYRREGGDELARLIYDRLTARGYRVFFDIESLRSGEFNKQLLAVIEECRDMIVVLPPGALERCSNEGDWLYLELEHAMKNRKNIIPVMMKGFEWPETFPKGLEGLQNYNGIHDSKDYFDAVIDKIVSLLQSRQTLFEILRKKGNKKTRVSLTRNRIRRAVFVLIAVLLAATGILCLPGKIRERELQKEAENVKAVFTPDEEMTITEFYDAQEIIKQRLDILSNGVDYDFTAREDQIEVSIPLDVFKDLDVEGTLEGEISRAMELYITGYLDEEGYLELLSEREGEPIAISREDIEKISKLVKIVAFARRGYPKNHEAIKKFNVKVIETMVRADISSTKIRVLKSLDTTREIIDYIIDNDLYFCKTLKAYLTPERYLHSISVARTAYDIAKGNNIEPTNAYLAGLLHDVAKNMDKEEMKKYMEELYPDYVNYPQFTYHQWIGSLIASEYFSITNQNILDGVKEIYLPLEDTKHSSVASLGSLLTYCYFVLQNPLYASCEKIPCY